MIRFYCTVCKKVKRARRQPSLEKAAHYYDAELDRAIIQPDPKNRPGVCAKHYAPKVGRRA